MILKYPSLIQPVAILFVCLVCSLANAQTIAFPGAEGFGKYTTGGRGGKVLIVTNLEDEGPGSFRKAAIANGKRVIVFAVSGTIHLKSKLVIKGDVTIAGQTAPGDGICIADHSVGIGGDNVIIRYLRFRMGDRYQNGGKVPGSGHDDVFSASKKKNIIIDHCSFTWSTDEVISVYKVDSTTLQWNIIAEPLNYSYHFEEGDKDFENHGYGGIWGGTSFSAYYNLITHCNSRAPRFNGVRLGAETELVDFRNNLIYNWGHNNIYGGEGGSYNLVNNYFKYGPETKKGVRFRIVNPNKNEKDGTPFGKYFVAGNYVDGAPEVNNDNRAGVHMGNNGTAADKEAALTTRAFTGITIPDEAATISYEKILQYGGASLPARDTLDLRIVRDVKDRTGRIIDVQGGYPHGTPYAQTVNAWPSLRQGNAITDTDKDGIPDEWEMKNGINPKDAADAVLFTIDKSYTNIEVYINSLVPAPGGIK